MFPGLQKQMELDLNVPVEAGTSGPPSLSPSIDDSGQLETHERRIESFLSIVLQDSVDVTLTNNRSTMISFRKKQGRLSVRVHRMFRLADDRTLKALAAYISGMPGTRAGRIIDDFIADHRAEIRASRRSRAPRPIQARGEHHDLSLVLDRVVERYFGGFARVRIGWGRLRKRAARPRRSGRISRALATYSFDDQTIRVSPVMDSQRVPDYVLEWVVYHELLHHVLPVEQGGGKKRFHTKKFRALERAFEHYEQARLWERDNLEWLLR